MPVIKKNKYITIFLKISSNDFHENLLPRRLWKPQPERSASYRKQKRTQIRPAIWLELISDDFQVKWEDRWPQNPCGKSSEKKKQKNKKNTHI